MQARRRRGARASSRTQVGVASTGVIGRELPREQAARAASRAAVRRARPRTPATSREAILTTDAGPSAPASRSRCRRRHGAAGGAGQGRGDDLAALRDDVLLRRRPTPRSSAETLDLLTGVCVKRSFDRISVDGQLSTSDTVFAHRQRRIGRARSSPSPPTSCALGEALDALHAPARARDRAPTARARERVGRIVVRGAPERGRAAWRASVADSPLVKTALHGGDPNFGRILQAAGQAWPAGRAVRGRPRDRGRARWCRRGDAVGVERRRAGARSSRPSAATRSSTC